MAWSIKTVSSLFFLFSIVVLALLAPASGYAQEGDRRKGNYSGRRALDPPSNFSSDEVPQGDQRNPVSVPRARTNIHVIPPSNPTPSSNIKPQGFFIPMGTGAKPKVGPPFAGYGYETPASLACLYGLVAATAGCNPNVVTAVPTTKGSKAIAIVDAFHYPTASADLASFNAQFGLPAATLTVKFATSAGACTGPQPVNDTTGWSLESALDLQMAHAMAPKAAIYLVEAQSDSWVDMLGAIKCANSLLTTAGGGELSMSFGSEEALGPATTAAAATSLDSAYFKTPNVVYYAASGDAPGVSWPSTSPNVVSVGGTSISRSTSTLNFQAHYSWADSGGGPSSLYARPSYQLGLAGIPAGNTRMTPDISVVANPYTGVWIYFGGGVIFGQTYAPGWYVTGGTSVSAPLVAGITNALGTFRANTAVELTALYNSKKANATNAFNTPTNGYCGPWASYSAGTNWNACTGLGTIKITTMPATTTPLRTVSAP